VIFDEQLIRFLVNQGGKPRTKREKLVLVYWIFELTERLRAPKYVCDAMCKWLQEEGYKGERI
jgi:hypothetical protein